MRNGMCQVHWDWIYYRHDHNGRDTGDAGLTLMYKPPPKNKPIVPASITGTFDYNGFTAKVRSVKSEEGSNGQKSWELKLKWLDEEEALGPDPTLEVGIAEDSKGHPYIYVPFNLDSGDCHGTIPLHLVGKRNTSTLTTSERLDLGLMMPGKKFLGHMSSKAGQVFEYDPAFDEYTIDEDEDHEDEGDIDEAEDSEEERDQKKSKGAAKVKKENNKRQTNVTRTRGVESWFVDGNRVEYGFVRPIFFWVI